MIRRALNLGAALAPLLLGVASRSRNTILVSAALTPVLLAIVFASDPSPRRGLWTLVLFVAAFDLLLGLLLYYVWLRLPW